MFRSRFFWKLYASYAALVLVTAVGIGVLVHERLSRDFAEELRATLEDNCRFLAPWAEGVFRGGTTEIGGFAEEIPETGVRVTLIGPEGLVLFDTDRDPASMDNHAWRPEVFASGDLPFGTAERLSTTLRQRMLYVARTLRDGESSLGVVRVALPTDDLKGHLAALRRRTALGAAFGMLVALILGLFVARRITAPLAEMSEAAEALGRGQFDSRVRNLSEDEIGTLGSTLNRLGIEVEKRIATISRDDARLRAMLSGMVEGVFAVDVDDRVVFSNRAARELFDLDYNPKGSRLWEHVRLTELQSLIAEARSGKPSVSREMTVFQEGGERILEVHANPFQAGDTAGVVVVAHDITELRRLERVRRDFVANVSHELKTPLTSIKGYVETLIGGALEDERNNRRFLGKIEANVERLTHLVADLLSLARIESDKGPTLERVDWRHLVVQALRFHERAAREKRIECRLAEGASPMVLGDPESMTQVVGNLLDNAISYTPEGGEVVLELVQNGQHAVLEVRDTGIGIPREDLERVFERFYRVDKARSRAAGGTGLGLAIVKHLVQAMDGRVAVESEFGVGTAFRVHLPLADV